MYKELIISIIIVISIFALDFFTQKYIKDCVEETSTMLGELKENINENENYLNENIDNIFDKWKNEFKKLSYFVEHNELEKVERSLTNIKSFIEVKNLNMVITSIDEADFVLGHIKEKNSLNLGNIF